METKYSASHHDNALKNLSSYKLFDPLLFKGKDKFLHGIPRMLNKIRNPTLVDKYESSLHKIELHAGISQSKHKNQKILPSDNENISPQLPSMTRSLVDADATPTDSNSYPSTKKTVSKILLPSLIEIQNLETTSRNPVQKKDLNFVSEKIVKKGKWKKYLTKLLRCSTSNPTFQPSPVTSSTSISPSFKESANPSTSQLPSLYPSTPVSQPEQPSTS